MNASAEFQPHLANWRKTNAGTRVPSSKSPSHTSRRPEEGGGFGRAPFTQRVPAPAPLSPGGLTRTAAAEMAERTRVRGSPAAPKAGNFPRAARSPSRCYARASQRREAAGRLQQTDPGRAFGRQKGFDLQLAPPGPTRGFPSPLRFSTRGHSDPSPPPEIVPLRRRSPGAAVDTDTRDASSPLYFSIGAAAGAPRRSGTRRCLPHSAPLRRSPPARRRHRIPARAAPPRSAPPRGSEVGKRGEELQPGPAGGRSALSQKSGALPELSVPGWSSRITPSLGQSLCCSPEALSPCPASQ